MLSNLIETLLKKTLKTMPLDDNVFDNPPDCEMSGKKLLNINMKRVHKNRELR